MVTDVEKWFRDAEGLRRAFITLTRDPEAAQRALLASILGKNQDTAFGRERGFRRIGSAEEMRSALPIQLYDDVSPWIERMLKGEKKILTDEDPLLFLETSGTTGGAKAIPRTPSMRGILEQGRMIFFASVAEGYPEVMRSAHSPILHLGLNPRPPLSHVECGLPWQSVTEVVDLSAEWSSPWPNPPWNVLPKDLTDPDERIYFRLRHALEADLLAILALQPNTTLRVADKLFEWLPRLARDVRHPERVRLLEKAMAKGPPHSFQDLWPTLRFTACWDGGNAHLFMDRLHQAAGPGTSFFPYPTASSEAVWMTMPVDHRPPYKAPLALQGVFAEFIPVDREAGRPPEPLFAWQLEEGRQYQLVITTTGGLYRYDTRDIVEVTSFYERTPCLRFCRRASTISITGEKLIEDQVIVAIRKTLERHGLAATEFVMFPRFESPIGYDVLVELAAAAELPASMNRDLNHQLCEENSEYASWHKRGVLSEVRVHKVPPTTFKRYRERKLVALAAKSGSQTQMKTVILHGDRKDLGLFQEVEPSLKNL